MTDFTMLWIGKAQEFAQRNMGIHFNNWLNTSPQAKAYRSAQYKPVRLLNGCSSRSPYAYGFTVPDYIQDLITAIGKADEHTAKYIMLYNGDGPCNPYN